MILTCHVYAVQLISSTTNKGLEMDAATIKFMNKIDLIEKLLSENKQLDNSDLAYLIAHQLVEQEK